MRLVWIKSDQIVSDEIRINQIIYDQMGADEEKSDDIT